MTDGNDGLLFADDDYIFNEDETKSESQSIEDRWKVIIADDEPEVHFVTKMVLGDFVHEFKGLEFLSAYSGSEVKQLIAENPDTAVLLLDVVMEEDNSGLDVIKYIREVVGNKYVRIILRTGQPGQAPEEKVVSEYDVSYYLDKTESTARRLYTTVTTALRTYIDIVNLDNMYKMVDEDRVKVMEINKLLGEAVARRTSAIRNLLNNAGQGFLSFGEDLIVDEEYSNECVRIFECDVMDRKFPELVYSHDKNEMHFLESVLVDAFGEKDPLRQESYLKLVSGEVSIKNKYVNIEYKFINDTRRKNSLLIMAVITDITEKRMLERKLKREDNNLKMIVSAVKYCDEIADSIVGFEKFFGTTAFEIINGSAPYESVVSKLLTSIHNYKGRFSQWYMDNTVKRIHNFESIIMGYRHDSEVAGIDELGRIFKSINPYQWLEEDLKLLRENLGDDFLERRNQMVVDKFRLQKIIKNVEQNFSHTESREVLRELRYLTCKPFRDTLKSYPQYVVHLSEKYGKFIKPVCIKGGEFPADAEKYAGVMQTLVHIFRNAVDHGIESPDERMVKGKEEQGTIKCVIKLLKNRIYISIKDDGKGIDLDKVVGRAVSRGIISQKEIDACPGNEVINIIFHEGVTSNDSVTTISGRGLGLYSVKYEVEKTGGRIKVKSSLDSGTTVLISLPYLG